MSKTLVVRVLPLHVTKSRKRKKYNFRYPIVVFFNCTLYWNKERDLTQSYDKCPFTNAKSKKCRGVFKVKSRVKTRQVREIWSQQLDHKQVPKSGTELGVRKGKRSPLACHTRNITIRMAVGWQNKYDLFWEYGWSIGITAVIQLASIYWYQSSH